MTESQWLACTEPEKMLHWLQTTGRLADRKARLFGAAVVRRMWHLLAERGMANGREAGKPATQPAKRSPSAVPLWRSPGFAAGMPRRPPDKLRQA
jgi:hypothetical protein